MTWGNFLTCFLFVCLFVFWFCFVFCCFFFKFFYDPAASCSHFFGNRDFFSKDIWEKQRQYQRRKFSYPANFSERVDVENRRKLFQGNG